MQIVPGILITQVKISHLLPPAVSLLAGAISCNQLKGSVKEQNMFHNYETEKITRKASDATEYIELFCSSTRDRHARRI